MTVDFESVLSHPTFAGPRFCARLSRAADHAPVSHCNLVYGKAKSHLYAMQYIPTVIFYDLVASSGKLL